MIKKPLKFLFFSFIFFGLFGVSQLVLTDKIVDEKVYIQGSKLYYGSQELYLAGAHMLMAHSVDSFVPGTRMYKEGTIALVANSGGNFINFGINTELAHGGSPGVSNEDAELYRQRLDQMVQWAKKYGLFYMFNFHTFGTGPVSQKFGGPGWNWHVADPNFMFTDPSHPYYNIPSTEVKNRAITVAKYLATKYGNDKEFVGIDPLNEPAKTEWTHWDNCINYYEEIMDEVLAINSDTIFLLEPPRHWGGYAIDWKTRGYMNEAKYKGNIIYQFHNYYYNHEWGNNPDAWGYQYKQGNYAQGDKDIRAWHNTNVMPVVNDGYPVFCGEFGATGTEETYPIDHITVIPGYSQAHDGQQQDMNALGIHYTNFYLYTIASNQPHAMLDSGGTSFNERGDMWVRNLPKSVLRPGDLTSTKTATTNPSNVYWSTGFEGGNFDEVTVGGGRLEYKDGATAVTIAKASDGEPVFSGQYSMKSEVIDPTVEVLNMPSSRAEIVRWNNKDGTDMEDIVEGYYGWAIYLPTDHVPADGWNIIAQLHCAGGAEKWCKSEYNWNGCQYFAVLAIDDNTGYLTLDTKARGVTGRCDRGTNIWTSNRVHISELRGRWFTAIIYLNAAQNGNVKLWIDGNLKVNYNGDFRSMMVEDLPPENQTEGQIDYLNHRGPHFKAGIYQKLNENKKTIYHDNLIAAKDYQTAANYLNIGGSSSGTTYSNDIVWSTRYETGVNEYFECTRGTGFLTYEMNTFRKGDTLPSNPKCSNVESVSFNGRNWIKASLIDPGCVSDQYSYNPDGTIKSYKTRAEATRFENSVCGSGYYPNMYNDLYYGVRIYLPPDFTVDPVRDGLNDIWAPGLSLVQLKEGNFWNGGLRFDVNNPNYFRILWRHYDYASGSSKLERQMNVPAIRGREFTVIFHVRATQNGVFEAWIDNLNKNNPQYKFLGDCRMEPTEAASTGRINRYIQNGLYTSLMNKPIEMYFADTVVATSFEAVKEFLGSDSVAPTPSPKQPIAESCLDDDGNYKPITAICDSQTITQYKCEEHGGGEFFCGNKILQRKQERVRYCPGDSDQCTGSWSSWQTISSSETQCQSWQKCENGDWSEKKPECKCSGECLEIPQNPRYYDNPKYPTNPFNPETSKDSTNIYLPVKFDWDDVPGGKDGWIEDNKVKSCTANCVQSYIISFQETTKGSYSTILNKSEYNYLDDPNAGSCLLKSNFTHNWSVQSCCTIDGKDCSPKKSDWKFTTNLAPELIEPYDPDWTGEEGGEPRWYSQTAENPRPVSFKWCPVEKAQSYYLQAYKDGTPYCPPFFCPIIITKETKEPIDVLVPEIDFDLDSFTKETNYSWQVATCLSDWGQDCKQYSQLWKFFGLLDLAQVKLFSPKNGEFVNFSHSLKWGHVQGAKSYRYRLSGSSPVPAFDFISLRKLWDEGKLKLDTEYFWQVQPCWDDKATECQEDGWSEEWKFTTTGKPPENLRTNSTIIPVKLDWEDIKGALSYKYEVYEINNSSRHKIVDESIFHFSMRPPSEALVDYPYLRQEKDYSWRVKTCADKEGEACGEWSNFQNFTTFKLSTPVNSYPEENGEFFASERYISWDSVLGAKFYQYKINYLFASEEEKSENCLALVETEIASQIIPASTSKTTSAFVSLMCLGEYQWQVQACLDENCQETGDWSGPWNFTLIGITPKMGFVPCGRDYNNPDTPWDEREPCGIKHIPILFKVILDFLLWRVGLIVLVLLVIFTAVILYISLGAPATIINIKSIWTSAALGYAIIFFAWMIINFFLKIFGITSTWWMFPF